MRLKEFLCNIGLIQSLSEPEINRLESAINLSIRKDGFNPQDFCTAYAGRTLIKETGTISDTNGNLYPEGLHYRGNIEPDNSINVIKYFGTYSS